MAIDVQPLRAGTGDLGCVVSGIDCNALQGKLRPCHVSTWLIDDSQDAEFEQIRDLVARWRVVVLRGQGALTPENQLALNKRFDPAASEYGHAKGSQRRSESILSKSVWPFHPGDRSEACPQGRHHDTRCSTSAGSRKRAPRCLIAAVVRRLGRQGDATSHCESVAWRSIESGSPQCWQNAILPLAH